MISMQRETSREYGKTIQLIIEDENNHKLYRTYLSARHNAVVTDQDISEYKKGE